MKMKIPGFVAWLIGMSRVQLALKCRDCDYMPRVENAGKIIDIEGKRVQVMHNGIFILQGSYHGELIDRIVAGLKGHHEPQEEKVFFEVLKRISPGGVMLELGSFWGYYSMWFQKTVQNAKNYLIEPNVGNLQAGKENFRLNGMSGDFTNAFIGSSYEKKAKFVDWDGKEYFLPRVSIDSFISDKNIKVLDILHSDIQGSEYEMLLGAQESIKQNKIKYIFISTHKGTHEKCLKFLKDHGFHIIAQHTISESYSADGLIVASAGFVDDSLTVNISKKRKLEVF